MLETKTVRAFDGAEVIDRAVEWSPPRAVPEDVRREAITALKARSRPPTMAQVDCWIANLAALCAGRDLPPETKLAAAASAIIRANYPAIIFHDPNTLDRAARRFSFWPSWAELAPALDEEAARAALEEKRLAVIAKGGEPASRQRREEPEEPWTGPRRLSAETEAMLEQWRRNPPPLPEMRRPHPAAAGPSGRNAMR
jgi:hypothetical protein